MSSLGVVARALSRGPIRRAMCAYLVFCVAELSMWVALLVWAYGDRGVGGAATVSVVQLVPAVVIAPLASVIGDRMRRGVALATGYAMQGGMALATAVTLATEQPFPVVCLGGALLTCAVTLTRPVHNAVMPELAQNPAELTAGNAATTAAEGVGAFLGPLTCGLLIVAGGAESVFALFGVLSMLSALAVLRLPVSGEKRPGEREGWLRNLSAGTRELRREPAAAVLLGTVVGEYVVVGLLDILLVVLALDALGTDQSGPGLLGSALGIGSVLGALGTITLVGRRRLLPALVLGLVAMGAPVATLGASGSLAAAGLLLVLCGAGKSFLDVAARTLLQRAVSEQVLARVFGLQEALMSGGLALGALLAPALLAWFGTSGALVATGLLLPALGVLAWRALRRLEARALPPGPFLDALRAVPFLRLTPLPVIESLSRRTAELLVPAGDRVIREGEPGDRFYLVLSGTLDVSRGGQTVRRLEPGASFGEIALLREGPRTATVTAIGPARLAVVGRHDFLAALGSVSGTRAAADSVAASYLAQDARAAHPGSGS